MKRRALGLIVLLLAASITVSCGRISSLFCGDSTPEGLVTADLPGRYHGDEGATLMLEPEGTFVAYDLHQRDFHLDADVTSSGWGNWQLATYPERGTYVELDFEGGIEWQFRISRNREDPRLWYYYGDADACFRKALNRST